MEKQTILITRSFFPDLLEPLHRSFNLIVWDEPRPPDRSWIVKNLPNADALITMLTDAIDESVVSLGAQNKLKVISQLAVGFDNIAVSTATTHRIPVGNTPGVLTETTADFTWALLMALARQVVASHTEVHNSTWRPWGPEVYAGADIHGATLGIIGFGRIGKAVARRAHGFGMKILYYGPKEKPDSEFSGMAKYTPLKGLLQQSDFVTLHAYLSPATRGMLGKTEFALMKPTAYLINTARGAMIDHQALFLALQAKQLAGAGLDVFDPEPIPQDHPLLGLPNVIITPHIASASLNTRRMMAKMTIENTLAGLRGEKLPYCVNPEVYGQINN
jgi:glyoxylate reductase